MRPLRSESPAIAAATPAAPAWNARPSGTAAPADDRRRTELGADSARPPGTISARPRAVGAPDWPTPPPGVRESLGAFIARGQPSVREVLIILRDLAPALDYARARGGSVRMPSVDDVLLVGGGAVLARLADPPARPADSRDSGAGATLAYADAARVARASDDDPILAWRAIAVELLVPHAADDEGAAHAGHVASGGAADESVRLRADLPPALLDLVARCAERDGSRRTIGLAELSVTLAALACGVAAQGTGAVPRDAGQGTRSGVSRTLRLRLGIATAVLALLAATLIWR